MKTYKVTIQAIVTKTYEIEANSGDEANEIGWDMFTVLDDDAEEKYEQNVIDVKTLDGVKA